MYIYYIRFYIEIFLYFYNRVCRKSELIEKKNNFLTSIEYLWYVYCTNDNIIIDAINI